MSVIDSLVITLGLDGANFEKGTKKANQSLNAFNKNTQNAGKSLADAGMKGADAFSTLRREALGALALFTGGRAIKGFLGDMSEANQALGNLSKQLDIAPQKLTQLHYAMRATGGSPYSVDNLFKNIQGMSATAEGKAQLNKLSGILGVNLLDKNGHVNANLLDQLAHSKQFQSLPRNVQQAYLSQIGAGDDITNLVTRKDYDKITGSFSGLGPTKEQIAQADQLRQDWTELNAQTNQVLQQFFSNIEPAADGFIKALTAIEKAHPEAIANGLTAIALALTALTAVSTTKRLFQLGRFLNPLKGLGKKTATKGAEAAAEKGAKSFAEKTVGKTVAKAAAKLAIDEAIGSEIPILGNAIAAAVWGVDTIDDVGFNGAGKEWLWNKGKQGFNYVTDGGGNTPQSRTAPILAYHADKQIGNTDLERLVGAVAMQESHGNPNAVSGAGAKGLLQFMDATAREQGISNPFDALQSWRGGEKYLTQLLKHYNFDTNKALAAYNWGQGNLDRDIAQNGVNWKSILPEETSDYLRKVNRNYLSGNIVDINNVLRGTYAAQNPNTTHHNITNQTTHNNPTHNITIQVRGGNGSPHDVARAVHQELSRELMNSNNMVWA